MTSLASHQFRCPNGHLLGSTPAQVGQQMACPMCGTVFLVPHLPGQEPPAAFSPPQQGQPQADQVNARPPNPVVPSTKPNTMFAPPLAADPLGANQTDMGLSPAGDGMDDAVLGLGNEEWGAGDALDDAADPLHLGASSFPGPAIDIGNKNPSPVLHIHCPNGHQLETPREMLAQEAMCPHCGVQFELKESQSVEAKSKREKELDRQWNRIGNRWLTWSITVVIIVVLTLFVLIVTTF